jgi:hypothetical protein
LSHFTLRRLQVTQLLAFRPWGVELFLSMGLSVGDWVVSVEAAARGVGSGANIVLYSSWMQSFVMEKRIDSIVFGKAKRRKVGELLPQVLR